MFHEGRQRHVKRLCKLTDRCGAPQESLDDGQPRRVCEGTELRVQLITHLDKLDPNVWSRQQHLSKKLSVSSNTSTPISMRATGAEQSVRQNQITDSRGIVDIELWHVDVIQLEKKEPGRFDTPLATPNGG